MNRLIYVALIVAAGFFMVACEEDPSEIGLGVQPGNEQLGVYATDTITIEAYSYLKDSVRTDETEYSFIGSHYDPVFGVTTATTYTSFSLSASSHDFGSNATFDSLVLMMQYHDYMGDTSTPQNLHVYKLTDTLDAETIYFSNQTHEYDPSVDYTQNSVFYPRPTDSVTIDTNQYRPHARIRLTEELGQFLMDANETAMETTEDFVEYFPGLVITADKAEAPGSGAVVGYNLRAKLSALRLFYHNDEDTTHFDYLVGSATPRTMHYEHYDYQEASPEFRQQLIEGDTSLGAQKLYLQSMAGVRTKIRFPGLKYTDVNMIVNDARLILTPQESANYDIPGSLYLNGRDTSNTIYQLPDDASGEGYFGGNLENNQYDFRLSMFIQGQVTGSARSNELVLGIPSEASSLSRLIINGTDNSNGQLKLKVVYTQAE